MLNQLEGLAEKNASKRNTLRILQFVPLPETYERRVLNFCFDYWPLQKKR